MNLPAIRDLSLISGFGRSLERKGYHSLQPEEFHGSYSQWNRVPDMTEQLLFHIYIVYLGMRVQFYSIVESL